jgi:hypothetical protein
MGEYDTLASFCEATALDIRERAAKFFRSKGYLTQDEEYKQAHVEKFYLMWQNGHIENIENIDGRSYREMEQFFNNQYRAFGG